MTNIQLAKYKDMTGTEVVLTKNDVINVLTNGASNITDGEIKTFVELCRAHKLNPFLREAYIVKYGNKPATLLVGKDAFTKRAQANPKFKGMQAGLCLIDKNGNYIERAGSMVLDGERIAGGWAKVFVEGYVEPVYDSVSFSEYAQKDAQGHLRSTWAKMPATMIRKVALVHALREAFPDDFSGMYDAAKIDTCEYETPEQTHAQAQQSAQANKRARYLAAVKERENECRALGIKTAGMTAWLDAEMKETDIDKLTIEQLETYGKHLAGLIASKKKLAESENA